MRKKDYQYNKIIESLQNNSFIISLSYISDYLIYIYTVLTFISHFISVGNFIEAILYYFFFVLIMLGYISKKYIALAVLFLGNCILKFFDIISIITYDYFKPELALDASLFWKSLFGFILNAIIAYFFINLLNKKTCPFCNSNQEKNSDFCTKCGKKLS